MIKVVNSGVMCCYLLQGYHGVNNNYGSINDYVKFKCQFRLFYNELLLQ